MRLNNFIFCIAILGFRLKSFQFNKEGVYGFSRKLIKLLNFEQILLIKNCVQVFKF